MGRYTLISTQHSLHLYQPIQLPVDYLTGETIPLKDAPIDRNWKDHLQLMPTAGLVGAKERSGVSTCVLSAGRFVAIVSEHTF